MPGTGTQASRPGSSLMTVSVTLPVRTVERIDVLAARRGLTRSALIREWTISGLVVAEREAPPEEGKK